MIDRDEIDAMASRMDIHAAHVQRDYVHGWLLAELFSSESAGPELVLKGGNGLRKGYFENARFSRDLDFTTERSYPNEDLGRAFNEVCRRVSERSGLEFDLDRTRVDRKSGADEKKEISEARLYFKDFYGEKGEVVISVRVDITQHDRIYLPVQRRELIHPYSDRADCPADINCVKLEEILASKLRCLLQRRHIADFYDLVYSTMVSDEVPVDRGELIRTFYDLTVFRRSPGVVKGLLVDLPFEALSRLWEKHIYCPSDSRFSFDLARERFVSLLDSLIGEAPIRDRSHTFFAAAIRNPIVEAAADLKLVQLRYDGIDRLVEPYAMTFKTPQGRPGREYLYVWDTTGGSRSGPGLKTFVPGKVTSVTQTSETFEPRFEVELRKAGGSEHAGDFGAQKRSRRTTRTRARAISGYRLQCPYCEKIFYRKNSSRRLNPHKDKHGYRCSGRSGFHI